MKTKSNLSKRILYILLPYVLPLCLIALGIVLLINEALLNQIFLAFGILVALIGLIEIVVYASRRKYEVQQKFLVTGIILLILGAILMIVPFTINTLIPVLIGVCILGSGISGIANTLSFRSENSSILIPILFALTNCLLGIFILIYVLFVNQNAGWNVIGIFMIISGALRIINEIAARTAAPKVSKVVEVETDYTDTTSDSDSEEA